MEKTEPGDVMGRSLYTEHTKGLGSSSPTGSHLSGRARKGVGGAVVLSLHCTQPSVSMEMTVSWSKHGCIHGLTPLQKGKKKGRNLKPLNRDHTTLNNREVLSPLSFLESS